MKYNVTEMKLGSGISLTRHLISWVLCLTVISLTCARASAQNLFATDHRNIDEFTPNGVQSTFAFGFNNPLGLAFDRAGNLFVADTGNYTGTGAVYKFTPAGVRTTFASGLNFPFALAFDRQGNLFVAAEEGAIDKFTPNGVRTTFASGLPGAYGLAFDSTGNLFVAAGFSFDKDDKAGAVYKFTSTGARTTFASGLNSPGDLALDSQGNLFVADRGYGYDFVFDAAIYKFTPSAIRSTVASVFPNGLAIDDADNLFVSTGNSILKFTPTGVRSTFATGDVGAMAFQPSQTLAPALVNVSGRGFVEAGENVLISGFIVTGSSEQPAVTRGLGPTLTSFGVTDALQDPMLTLHNSNSMMAANDNWQNAANASQIPMNYRPPDTRESAIMTTLSPGAYTTVLSGKNGTAGNGLLEVYSTLSGLSNVSTRGFVGTGDHVLIGGFSSSGSSDSIQLVIRALGPTLTRFGVNGALADPTLTLVNSNGNVLSSNDNWKNTQQSTIQATGFSPPNDLESAIVATLPNGNYTAIVAGKNGGTGVGLLEVYKVALAASQ
jgi:sugar lactone lactonase YvrE